MVTAASGCVTSDGNYYDMVAREASDSSDSENRTLILQDEESGALANFGRALERATGEWQKVARFSDPEFEAIHEAIQMRWRDQYGEDWDLSPTFAAYRGNRYEFEFSRP